MVKHVVLYTLRDGVDKDEAVKLIASVLEPLVGKIPGLLKLEVRRCFAGSDYALYSEFDCRNRYRPTGHIRCTRRRRAIFTICWLPAQPRTGRHDPDSGSPSRADPMEPSE